jgi:hypothetical protein
VKIIMTDSTIRPGKYRHSKSKKEYEVIGTARHSETLEEMVVYRALYGKGDIWVRPKANFSEEVVLEGKPVPRFVFIDES